MLLLSALARRNQLGILPLHLREKKERERERERERREGEGEGEGERGEGEGGTGSGQAGEGGKAERDGQRGREPLPAPRGLHAKRLCPMASENCLSCSTKCGNTHEYKKETRDSFGRKHKPLSQGSPVTR